MLNFTVPLTRLGVMTGLACLVTLPPPTAATDFQWTGLDGDWNDPGNWSPSGKPNATAGTYEDNALLEFNDAIHRVITGVGSAYQIRTGNSGGGSVTWNISAGNNFSTSGCGVRLGAGTTLNLWGGSLSWDSPGNLELTENASVNQSGGSIYGSGVLSIAGIWNLSGSGLVGSIYTIHNTGTINQTGGALESASALANGGIYNLSAGEVQGHVLNSGEFNLLGGGTYLFDGMHNVGLLNATGTSYFDYLTGLELVDGTVMNIQGTPGTVVFYDPSSESDSYLGGLTYQLTGGGYLMPIPEPSAGMLWGLGGAGLIFWARYRGKSGKRKAERPLTTDH